ncbi:hypothetical protein VOLCADRAFT_91022 [Volvox carteri f. nagariensis]|uniref:Uncharacterized protein n=1 Tax=Volvox carteri f. nagariensis TaxID=3068 RepID=D8TVZ3_VOLCA|nr:uncharacterized protein VOLCADRAFT_91022 [Volvox carteri f. nagariensis]EFJ48279.1 hypothetical protein VOLCADRAFT_91022 [Volvox carteri f. nagariensis]|eukprot:XP_002950533.1 hypothetical protein VOLCADRAFT_91022 [Volvox carteri f. nagariensis]
MSFPLVVSILSCHLLCLKCEQLQQQPPHEGLEQPPFAQAVFLDGGERQQQQQLQPPPPPPTPQQSQDNQSKVAEQRAPLQLLMGHYEAQELPDGSPARDYLDWNDELERLPLLPLSPLPELSPPGVPPPLQEHEQPPESFPAAPPPQQTTLMWIPFGGDSDSYSDEDEEGDEDEEEEDEEGTGEGTGDEEAKMMRCHARYTGRKLQVTWQLFPVATTDLQHVFITMAVGGQNTSEAGESFPFGSARQAVDLKIEVGKELSKRSSRCSTNWRPSLEHPRFSQAVHMNTQQHRQQQPAQHAATTATAALAAAPVGGDVRTPTHYHHASLAELPDEAAREVAAVVARELDGALPVVCKDHTGLFMLRYMLVACDCDDCRTQPGSGKRICWTPIGFEEHAGMGSSKKWKKSIRLLRFRCGSAAEALPASGSRGGCQTLGEWLERHGLRVRTSRLRQREMDAAEVELCIRVSGLRWTDDD